ncbi:MAG: hypothetical protein MR412_02370 [Firmicutes bacterium]|nr:hypothetical protein [Bacillota bacterium]MDY5676612.1 hypothetical protein [Eubacteriales bacterium]
MKKEEFELTTNLLDEAYKNVRMASFAIDSIITKIENPDLENLLRKQNEFYLKTTKKIEKISEEFKHKPADINIFLKGTSFAAIKVKTMLNNDTTKLATMLIDGTTMGITEMIKAQSEYPCNADSVKKITNSIVNAEEDFVESLKDFL